MEKVRRFKFLRDGLRSDYNDYQWDIGVWHTTECTELCHGFNCSRRIVDAMQYVSGEILAEVEVRGTHFDDKDKSTHAEMRIIKALKWTQADSVSLAIYAARLVLGVYESAYPGDDRPRIAIEAAERWLADPSVKNQDAAGDAGDAARAAGDAAWAAAGDAGDAARAAGAAAGAAAWAAGAAWAAAWAAGAAGAAAGAAAWAAGAAWAAAWAAGDAARAAARAAGAAAGAAAWAAARAAAWAAARAAAEAAIESYLLSRLDQMEEWA